MFFSDLLVYQQNIYKMNIYIIIGNVLKLKIILTHNKINAKFEVPGCYIFLSTCRTEPVPEKKLS